MDKKKLIKIVGSVLLGIIIIIVGYFLYTRNNNYKIEDNIKEEIHPLLYEVTKDGMSNKIYLFGSIHAANINELKFPDYIIDSYNKSNNLACEFNIVDYQSNQEKVMLDAAKMLYQDGTTIKDYLSNSTYEKLINFLNEKNFYMNLYEYYKPYFFQSLLTALIANDAKINTQTGIDEYFIKKAINDKKNILEVETSEFQTDLLLSFPDSLYELIINESIDNYDEEVKNLKSLYTAWKMGNIDELLKTADEDLEIKDTYTKEQINLINDYNKKLIDDRNTEMTKKVVEYYNNNQNTFFMVGVYHIIGDNGIAKQLENEGYTIKQIQ